MGKGPHACTLALNLGALNRTAEGKDRKPCGRAGGGTEAASAKGRGTPPHPHWEGGAMAPRLRMQGLDPAGREAALGPFFAILGCLCGPLQTAPRPPGRGLGKRLWAVQLFPGLWELPGLSGCPWELRLQGPGFVLIYWGVGWGRSLLALGVP